MTDEQESTPVDAESLEQGEEERSEFASLYTCGMCKFGVSIDLTDPLQCHYNPPSVFMLPGPGGRGVMPVSTFPPVRRNETACSKFTLKLGRSQ